MTSLDLAPLPILDVAQIQEVLHAEHLDGWLLYDFRGINPIAVDVAGTARRGGQLSSRRWYYLVPASGEPRKLVHVIEPRTLDHLPGSTTTYAGRDALERGLEHLLDGIRKVAMEYSPRCAIPYISRVDAGTVELVRSYGVDVVSSGDLVQRFAAVWDERAITSHEQASEKLYRIKDRAFEFVARAVRDKVPTTEFVVQQAMAKWFAEEGLISDADPNVSVGKNAGDPHYLPTAGRSDPLRPDAIVLLDLWGKLNHAGAVFADITWVGYTGSRVPEREARVFGVVASARDAAVNLVQDAAARGVSVRGWEVDRAARDVLEKAGFARQILHRTGHSLGDESVHGTGVNMDDFETHDERRLLPGTGFTIEPGLYFDDFGVRSEINLVMTAREARVTGPRQDEILALL